jgi:hypothetical protein
MWMFIGNPERVESTNVQRIIVQVGQPSVPAPGETRGLQCRMAHTRGAVDALFRCCRCHVDMAKCTGKWFMFYIKFALFIDKIQIGF